VKTALSGERIEVRRPLVRVKKSAEKIFTRIEQMGMRIICDRRIGRGNGGEKVGET
jgi:hypothetical protein